MKICTEIAEFKLIDRINSETFLELVDHLEEMFHSKQEGFINTELLIGKNAGEYTMIQHWESKELAHKASRNMMQSDVTLAFRNALDPKHVKLHYYEQIGTW